MPENTIYVGRPTEWGNPFHIGLYKDFTHQDAVKSFELYVDERPYLKDKIVKGLKGKNLACWCPPDKPCHADILLKIANS